MYTVYTNEICAPFCTSPNCSTDSYTVLIDLGLAELHNVLAESGFSGVAPQGYIEAT